MEMHRQLYLNQEQLFDALREYIHNNANGISRDEVYNYHIIMKDNQVFRVKIGLTDKEV